jgi:hypothetical protein
LREVLKYEATNKTDETPSLEAYIAEFTNYLRRTKSIQSGLGAYVAELGVATTKPGSQQSSNQPKGKKLTPWRSTTGSIASTSIRITRRDHKASKGHWRKYRRSKLLSKIRRSLKQSTESSRTGRARTKAHQKSST